MNWVKETENWAKIHLHSITTSILITHSFFLLLTSMRKQQLFDTVRSCTDVDGNPNNWLQLKLRCSTWYIYIYFVNDWLLACSSVNSLNFIIDWHKNYFVIWNTEYVYNGVNERFKVVVFFSQRISLCTFERQNFIE